MLQLNLSSVSESVMDTRSAPAPSGDTAGKSSFAEVIQDQGQLKDKTTAPGKLSGAEAKGKITAASAGDEMPSQEETAQDAEQVAADAKLDVKEIGSKKSKAESAKQGDEDVDFLQHLQASLSADTAIRTTPVSPEVSVTVDIQADEPEADPAAVSAGAASSGKKLPSSLAQCLVPEEGAEGTQEMPAGEGSCAPAIQSSQSPVMPRQTGELPGEVLVASGMELASEGDEASLEQLQQGAAAAPENGKSVTAASQLQTQVDTAALSSAGNPVDKAALTSFFSLNHAGAAEKTLSAVATAPDEAETTQVSSLAKSGASGKTDKKETLSLLSSVDKEATATPSDKAGEASLSSQVAGKGDAVATAAVTTTATPETMTGAISSHSPLQRAATAEHGAATSENNQLLSTKASETYRELAAVDLGSSGRGAQQLAERVSLMIGQKWHEAELELEPLGLGKMQIQLSVGQDQQASVQFVVQQQHSREAVEQTLPRLKEMLAQQGIQLTQSSVQQQSSQQGQTHSGQQQGLAHSGEQGQRSGGRGAQGGENGAETTGSVQNLLIQRSHDTGIDFYA